MKIGITGASGQLGRLVIAHLSKKVAKENLVALVRNPEKVSDLGIEARAFDYDQPENLSAALNGIDSLLLISGSEIGKREQQHKNVVDAAKNAGVKSITYTSLLHADTSTLVLAPEHLATEEAIKASGMAFTLLRNGWYTENYTASVPGALQHGAFIGSAGEGKISSAARNDYAEAAALIVAENNHQGKTLELSGDEFYTLTDLAKELSAQAGKEIPYQNLSENDFTKALEQVGLPEPVAQVYAGFDTAASKGDLYDEGTTLSQLLGRKTTSLSEVIKNTLANH